MYVYIYIYIYMYVALMPMPTSTTVCRHPYGDWTTSSPTITSNKHLLFEESEVVV